MARRSLRNQVLDEELSSLPHLIGKVDVASFTTIIAIEFEHCEKYRILLHKVIYETTT